MVMYKIKFSTTNMKYNNKVIKKHHCNELLDKLEIRTYNYVKECVVLHKTLNGFTHKSLEIFCNKEISEKPLKTLIKKIKKYGMSGDGKVEMIDIKSNDVIYCYDYECVSKEDIEKRNCKFKNRSIYKSHILFKQTHKNVQEKNYNKYGKY
jgi:hypothetical protein